MSDRIVEREKPNGPVAAAMLAGGIGAATMGIVTTLSEASASIGSSLNWYSPVGPLTGKVLISIGVFFLSWIILYMAFREKEVNFSQIFTITMILLIIGLLGTFPPFFEIFAAE